jgi:arylsulfatase
MNMKTKFKPSLWKFFLRLNLSARLSTCLGLAGSVSLAAGVQAQTPPANQPNILVIMADDIGYWNLSAYNLGMMGYHTPNIDRIAKEGAIFTDLYAQQSCTAGRSAFITGQSPFRTGLLKVGLPGAKEGISDKDPELAELLKPLGYATGQFGKNHLGDLNEFLPTVHGFDEFFGNLYHLQAEEEPENPDYPKSPQFAATFGPRGVLHCWATGTNNPTVEPRFGMVGKQIIEDTGPLTRKRMETIDETFLASAMGFIDKSHKDGKPFFVWFCPTRMHIWTHLSPQWKDKTGLGVYADGMAEVDDMVGKLLKQLDDLGIAKNTIVLFTTDNGAEVFSWPDGGTTPFHGEKNTSWEGGFRVPGLLRWPGHIPPGSQINGIVSHEDWVPTFMAAVGQPNIKEQLLTGYTVGGKTYKVHLDGYDLGNYLAGQGNDPRKEFFYWTDDGDLAAIRYDRWKMKFLEQRAEGLLVWQEPYAGLRFPKLEDMLGDPFERATFEASDYDRWRIDRAFLVLPAVALVKQHLATYSEFPPRQPPGSFNLGQALQMLQRNMNGNN